MRERFRLRKPADFRKVFKEGKRFLSPHFVLYMRKNILQDTCLSERSARIGISIAKRHFKLATRRNRLRRVAKELFKKELSARFKEYDFVVTSRQAYPSSNINEVIKEIKYLITKPRLRKT